MTLFSEGDTNSKADKTVALICESNWNLQCWFLWLEENRKTKKKTQTLGAGTRTNNKLNRHVTPGSGFEPGPQRWEVSALNAAPSLLPKGMICLAIFVINRVSILIILVSNRVWFFKAQYLNWLCLPQEATLSSSSTRPSSETLHRLCLGQLCQQQRS